MLWNDAMGVVKCAIGCVFMKVALKLKRIYMLVWEKCSYIIMFDLTGWDIYSGIFFLVLKVFQYRL